MAMLGATSTMEVISGAGEHLGNDAHEGAHGHEHCGQGSNALAIFPGEDLGEGGQAAVIEGFGKYQARMQRPMPPPRVNHQAEKP